MNKISEEYPLFIKHSLDYLIASIDDNDCLNLTPRLFDRATK